MGYQPISQESTSTWNDSSETRIPESEHGHRSSSQHSLPRDNHKPNEKPPSDQDGESAPSSQPPRRFLAQPIETSSRSSNSPQTGSSTVNKQNSNETAGSSSGNETQADSKPRRRILPQPVETTTTSRRGPTAPQQQRPQQQNPSLNTSTPRRFKPVLIETDSRSVNSTENPQLSVEQSGPGPAARRSPRRNTSPHLPESKFSYANLIRRQETRRHSFRVPSLPRIPSVSSEDSDDNSAVVLSPLPPSQQSQKGKGVESDKPFQDNCNGALSEYLLSIAAQSAQEQLKDQTLAAFPNEQVYEPVDHFAIDEEEDDQSSMYPRAHHLKSRRQSSADLSWELEYMRQHKEEAEQRLRAMLTSTNRREMPRDPPSAPKPRGPSPPMLGGDIVLPFSTSPDGTICENTNAENGTETMENPCTGCGGLWCAASEGDDGRGAGLWMGTCHKNEGSERESHAHPGIVTPMLQDSEFEPVANTRSHAHVNPIDMKGSPEPHHEIFPDISKSSIDEFDDSFVTQIYNYVSLGYPCVARYYDHELSRISGIPIEEIRKDDLHTDAKGYVVAPESDKAIPCMRWKALRLYIWEWARQQPIMAEDETGLEAWGMPERRGSWAI